MAAQQFQRLDLVVCLELDRPAVLGRRLADLRHCRSVAFVDTVRVQQAHATGPPTHQPAAITERDAGQFAHDALLRHLVGGSGLRAQVGNPRPDIAIRGEQGCLAPDRRVFPGQ